MRVALLYRACADAEHHIGTRHLAHFEEAAKPADPDGRAAVGSGENRAVDDALQVGVDLRFHDALHAGDADIAFVTEGKSRLDPGERAAYAGGMNLHAQDFHATLSGKFGHGHEQLS